MEKMFSGNPIATYVCIGIICYFVLGSLLEMLFGIKRGWKRQLVHLAFSVVALAGAFFITKALIGYSANELNEQRIADLLIALEDLGLTLVDEAREFILAIDPHLASLILAMPTATVFAPLLFTLIFILLNFLLKIASKIVGHFVPKAHAGGSRLIGMGIGLAEGVIVCSLMLLPAAAWSDLAKGAVEVVDEVSKEEGDASVSDEIHSLIDQYLDPISANPVLAVTKALGGNAMIDSFATVKLDEGKTDMREEIYSALTIVTSSHGFSDINWENLDAEDKDALTLLVSSISESEYLSEVFAGIFKTVSNLSDENGEPMISVGAGDDLTSALFNDVIYILGHSTKDTVGEDLATFKEMFFILSDGDVIAAFNGDVSTETMINVLNTRYDEEHTVVTKLITTIRENERTKPLIATLTKLSITIMAEDMGLGEGADRLYDNVTDGLSGINHIDPDDYGTPDEFNAAISDSIKSTLTENGITLEEEMIDDLAGYAADKRRANDELTEDDIQDIILEYYAIYANNTSTP